MEKVMFLSTSPPSCCSIRLTSSSRDSMSFATLSIWSTEALAISFASWISGGEMRVRERVSFEFSTSEDKEEHVRRLSSPSFRI